MGAEFQRLAEGEPVLRAEAAFGDRGPQDQDIDAAVGTAGRGVLRQAERRRDTAPGLDPRQAALLEFGDDPVGDFLIEAGAVGKGFVGRRRVGHRLSPRRAGESLLSPEARVTVRAPPFCCPFPATSAVAAETWKRGIGGLWPASAIATRQGGDGSPERGKREPASRPRGSGA